jgi:hypothetical protein
LIVIWLFFLARSIRFSMSTGRTGLGMVGSLRRGYGQGVGMMTASPSVTPAMAGSFFQVRVHQTTFQRRTGIGIQLPSVLTWNWIDCGMADVAITWAARSQLCIT